jgi:hypothetical protein
MFFIVGNVELITMLMNGPNNQFHHRSLPLIRASWPRRPAMLRNMDRARLGNGSSGMTDLAKVRKDTDDCCAYVSRGTIRGKGTKDIRKEVETNIIECIEKGLPSQSGNFGPEVVGGIKAESSIEANLDIETSTLDFFFGGNDSPNQGFSYLGMQPSTAANVVTFASSVICNVESREP